MNSTTNNTTTVTVPFDTNLTAASDGQVVRRKSPAALAFALVILLIGAALLLAASAMEQKTGIAYSSSLVFGIVGLCVGVSIALFGGKEWVYAPTKSKIRVRSKFIDPTQVDFVCRSIEKHELPPIEAELRIMENSSARIDLYTSADGAFAAAQVFQYVPYTYSPVTPVCCAVGEEAKRLARFF
ncbi:MAG: hypothetical protein LBM20_05315 [Rikenellaceae bacterium]|jgi:hypothetical protein|nr:hypothetical protein [Rikenellaceae bacterium]